MSTLFPAAILHAPAAAALLVSGTAQLNQAARATLGREDVGARFARALAERGAASGDFVFEGWSVHAEAMPPEADGGRIIWLNFGVPGSAEDAAGPLADALGLAGIVLWRHDLATGKVDWNAQADTWFADLGVRPPDRIDDMQRLIHPDDRAALREAGSRAVAAREPVSVECRLPRPDGSQRHVLARGVAQRDARGRAVSVLGVVIDMTENAQAKQALAQLTDSLRLATASAQIGIRDWDLQTHQQTWDEQMRHIYGVDDSWQTISVESWYALLHPRDADDALDDLMRSVRDGTPYESAFRIIRPDGQVRHVLARGTIYRDDQGRPIRLVGIDWDVTARRTAERAVTEAMDRLQLATSAAGIGIWELDLRTDDTVWSPQMYTLFGATDQLGADPRTIWRSALFEEDRPRVAAAKTRAIRRRQPYQAEFRIRWPDGSVHWLATRGMVQFDESGHPVKLVGVKWDVTEERQAEEALRAKDAAERANRAKSEFLSRMSHELRTPLNGILGFAQLLANDERRPLLPEQRVRLRRIEEAGWHLLALINDLLDLSRIENGALSMKLEAVDLDAVAEKVVSLLAQAAGEAGVEIILVKHAGHVPTARADAVRVRQILTNLLSNAVKYNRSGGSVTVASFESGSARVGFSVRDTGLGMTANQRAHLFQPFNRLGREASNTQGTGIGLVIAKGLAEQMGGSIRVESTAGAGTEFRVELPREDLAPPPVAAMPAPAMIGERADVRGTVLYIEDNPLNALIIQEYLSYRPQVRYLHAPDGETGIRLAAEMRPDILLVDMNLPDTSGGEVLARIRAGAHPPAHCIMLSANVPSDEPARTRAGGFDEYWTKPVTIGDFLSCIDRLLTGAA